MSTLQPTQNVYGWSLTGSLSESHLLVLNKFNVVEHHSLVITRRFESQNEPLTRNDLEATANALALYPSGAIAFFNCGWASGRSQPHKHLQIVPLPLDPALRQAPLSALLRAHPAAPGAVTELRALPFRAYAVQLASLDPTELTDAFDRLYERAQAGPATPAEAPPPAGAPVLEGLPDTGPAPRVSFNTVLVDDRSAGLRYMAVFPRRAERWRLVGVNALGFAGTLLLKSDVEREFVVREGPLRILAEVGQPW